MSVPYLAPLLLVAACTPISPTAPFHFTETAQVVPRGRLGVTGAAGVGNLRTIGGGVGLGGRARLGVADGHELGLEAALVLRINDDEPTDERPWLGPTAAFLGKVSWKAAILPWLAASAGAGGSHAATGNALAGDGALIGSTPGLLWRRLRPYVGVRGAVAVPVGRDTDEAGGITKLLCVAGGTAYELGPRVRLFAELGLLNSWNRGYLTTDADPDRMIESKYYPGGYGVLALEFLLEE